MPIQPANDVPWLGDWWLRAGVPQAVLKGAECALIGYGSCFSDSSNPHVLGQALVVESFEDPGSPAIINRFRNDVKATEPDADFPRHEYGIVIRVSELGKRPQLRIASSTTILRRADNQLANLFGNLQN
jgi:hypothetical protein